MASSSNAASSLEPPSTVSISSTLHQSLNVPFPPRTFGKKNPVQRSFQASWYKKWEWLNYDVSRDCVLCFICCKAVKDGKVKVTKLSESSFLVDGFTNWKDATIKFAKHQSSDFHKRCSEAHSFRVDVGELLDHQAATEKRANREYLLKVLCFLARQGLSLRGSGDESDSNLLQLLLLRADDFPAISKYLERKQLKYVSHDVQNEFLSIMAMKVLHEITASLQSSANFTIMVDETTDMSNKEQVVLVF